MKLYFAVIGRTCAGKGTIFSIIKEEFGNKYQVSVHGFSNPLNESIDAINRILARRGLSCRLEKSRPNQQDISTELRGIFGEELLGETLQKRFLNDSADIIGLDGVRRPKDIEMLRYLPHNCLVYVYAEPLEKRLVRLRERNDRPGDAEKTLEQFQVEQAAEAENLIETLRPMADFELDNSPHDPEFKALRAQVVSIINEKLRIELGKEKIDVA